MRAAYRTFWTKSQYESTQSVSKYMPAAQAFSFLKFYQHSVLFFCKVITTNCHYMAEYKKIE